MFGQTEMSSVTCVLRGEDAIRKMGSVGTSIINVEARIVDEELNDVPVGGVGEIVYRGPTVMREYWRNPGATAEAFAGGWFHSGDLCRMDDDGFITVVDRAKDMIVEHCRTRLASYKKPTSLVVLDELPRTASGKVQKFRLRTAHTAVADASARHGERAPSRLRCTARRPGAGGSTSCRDVTTAVTVGRSVDESPQLS
jgi:acyl-CoA synthetase (AMP-forming)/AMP-acid ligase II